MQKIKVICVQKLFFTFLIIQISLVAYERVSLDEAIRIGLKNSFKQKMSQIDRKIAWQQHEQSLSALYPSLSLQSGVVFKNKPSNMDMDLNIDASALTKPLQMALKIPDGVLNHSFVYNTNVQVSGKRIWQSALEARYPLYTGGKINSIVKQAKLNSQIKTLESINTTKDLRWRITQAYIQAWWSRQMYTIASNTYERMNFTYELTRDMLDAGSTRVKKTDMLRTKSILESTGALKEELKIAKEVTLEYLNFVVNSPRKIEPLNMDFNEELTISHISDEDVVRENPKMQMMQLATQIHEAKKDEAKSGYLPSVIVYAKGTHALDDYKYGYFNEKNKNTFEAGVGVEWRLFDGFLTQAKVEEARLQLQKSKIEQEYVFEGLIFEYRRAKINYEGKRKKLKNLQISYEKAKENRQLNQKAYVQELVETKDMIESQIMESLAEGSFLDAQKELLMQEAIIKKLTWRQSK